MKIVSKTGDPKFATVYVAEVRNDPKNLIEFVDAVDPRYPKSEKWVIVVSTQIGCPVGCLMCDSGTFFYGNLTKEEIFAQIDHIFSFHHPSNHPKLKIQFARMGEPALNPNVLEVLQEMSERYEIGGILPCIATTAPHGSEQWFERLIEIKDKYYSGGRFQLQFSLNSTDESRRQRVMPIKKWSLKDISRYGEQFYKAGDRKVVLNFALANSSDIETSLIADIFNPDKFIIKITPVNPTESAISNNFESVISHETPDDANHLADALDKLGFETIISIGAREEIEIGSNCGQSARREYVRLKNATNMGQ